MGLLQAPAPDLPLSETTPALLFISSQRGKHCGGRWRANLAKLPRLLLKGSLGEWWIADIAMPVENQRADDDELTPAKPKNPYSGLTALLWRTRQCHEGARHALAQPKPDNIAAKEAMKLARESARRAVRLLDPLQHEELRRRIVGDEPMSDQEWERLWPSFLRDRN